MTQFLIIPLFTRVKVIIKNLLKRNLPTPVGSAERNFFPCDLYGRVKGTHCSFLCLI